VAKYINGERALVDAHLHVTLESLIQYPDDFRAFLATCGAKLGRAEKSEGIGDFSEADFNAGIRRGGTGIRIGTAVFVERSPRSDGRSTWRRRASLPWRAWSRTSR